MEFIELDLEENTGVIRLNNPDKRNALNRKMIQELASAIKESPGRILRITGNGTSFCAGADLDYMSSMKNYSEEENIADSNELAGLFYAMINEGRPIVCVCHGHVFGGGLGLLAASDIIIAEEKTQFCFSEARLGLAPAVISPFVTARIGFSQARRYFLSSEVFSAAQSQQMGLVNEIYKDDYSDILGKVERSLLSNGPEAMASIKKMMNSQAGLEKNSSSADLARLIARLRVSAEGQEGIAAFFAKRKPRWVEKG